GRVFTAALSRAAGRRSAGLARVVSAGARPTATGRAARPTRTGLASIRPRLRSSLSPRSHLSTTSVRGEIGARAHPVVVAEDLPRASHLKNGSEHGDTDKSPRQATVHSRGTPIPRTYRESWGAAQQQEPKEPRQNRGSSFSYSDPEVTRTEPRVLSRTMTR